jgi:hypothetical protein
MKGYAPKRLMQNSICKEKNMNINQKDVGWGFWLAWVLASAIGFGLGAVLGIGILITMRVPDSAGFPIFFGAIFGAIGAFGQWMLIRRQISEAGLWIPFSALSFMLAVTMTAGMSSSVSPDFNPFFILAGIYGLLGGFLQGLILQKQGVPIGWWIAASLLGGLLGGAMNGSAAAAVQTNEAWRFGTAFFLIWFRLGAPIGLGLGIMTGGALFWFLRHPKSRATAATTQGAQ